MLHQTKNQILLALDADERDQIRRYFEFVELPSGKVLYRADEPLNHIYFPSEAVISIVATTETGQSAEVGIIGNEGVVGVEALMGAASTPHEIVSLFGDGAVRIKISDILDHFNQCGQFHERLLRFTQKFMVQLSQKALCNRLHALDQRLSRWLLMCDDRTPTDTMHITQEFLATMLGSTRASVTLAAIEMQNQELITYSRGNITILDRKRIEAVTCDCYETIRNAYEDRA